MSVNIKVTGGLKIEWGQIDPKVTGGLILTGKSLRASTVSIKLLYPTHCKMLF